MRHVAAAGADLNLLVHIAAGVAVGLVLLVQLGALGHEERLDEPRVAERAAQVVRLGAHDELAGVDGGLEVRERVGLGLGAPQDGQVAFELFPFAGEVVLPLGGGGGERLVVVVEQGFRALGRVVAKILALGDDVLVDGAVAAVLEVQALAFLLKYLGELSRLLSCGHLPSFLL